MEFTKEKRRHVYTIYFVGTKFFNICLYVFVMSRTRFRVNPTLYSCLNVKELFARSSREIWRWSDCNWTRTQNHLVLKWTLNHLAKRAKCSLSVRLSGSGFESSSSHFNICVLSQCMVYWILFQNRNTFIY